MKKVFLILILTSFSLNTKAQFLKGIGVFGSLTESAHFYQNKNQDLREYNGPDYAVNPQNYYPRNHISKEYFSWGAGIFAEFLNNDYVRWQTEFAYMKKGAREKELIDPFGGARSGSFSVNKYTYIQWNNYLKFYNPAGYNQHWYIMSGIRLEYLFRSSASAYQQFAGSFAKFWFSGNVGVGYEFPIFKKLFGFVEYHWNPDILKHRFDNVRVRSRTFELRVGVIMRPRRKSIDDCNAPRYNGPNY